MADSVARGAQPNGERYRARLASRTALRLIRASNCLGFRLQVAGYGWPLIADGFGERLTANG